MYVNDLLEDLKSHKIGLKIGTTYVGCPACADDIASLSSAHTKLQTMVHVSTAIWHSKQDRVSLHPEKTKAVILNKAAKLDRLNLSWTLDNTIIYPSKETTHLGIVRSEIKENNLIDIRLSIIAIARRTLYILLKNRSAWIERIKPGNLL